MPEEEIEINNSIKNEKRKKRNLLNEIIDEERDMECKKNLKAKDKKKKKLQSNEVQQGKDHEDGDCDDNDAEKDSLHEPTLDELRESEKPENQLMVETKRQKKKQKHKKHLETVKDESHSREKKRNEEYLTTWKNERTKWKFEKLRQISIQQSVFDENKIETHIWPIAIEYLSGTKGAAKQQITKLAHEVIEKLDDERAQKRDETEKQAIVESITYRRARDLLQSFD